MVASDAASSASSAEQPCKIAKLTDERSLQLKMGAFTLTVHEQDWSHLLPTHKHLKLQEWWNMAIEGGEYTVKVPTHVGAASAQDVVHEINVLLNREKLKWDGKVESAATWRIRLQYWGVDVEEFLRHRNGLLLWQMKVARLRNDFKVGLRQFCKDALEEVKAGVMNIVGKLDDDSTLRQNEHVDMMAFYFCRCSDDPSKPGVEIDSSVAQRGALHTIDPRKCYGTTHKHVFDSLDNVLAKILMESGKKPPAFRDGLSCDIIECLVELVGEDEWFTHAQVEVFEVDLRYRGDLYPDWENLFPQPSYTWCTTPEQREGKATVICLQVPHWRN